MKGRNRQVIRNRHTEYIVEQQLQPPPPSKPATPKHLNIIVHNKRDGTLSPDVKSLASKKSSRSGRSNRSNRSRHK